MRAHTGIETLSDVELADEGGVNGFDDILSKANLGSDGGANGHQRESEQEREAFLAKQARRIARNPCKHLWIGIVASVALSAVAMIVGEFSVSVEAGGWQSRGTLIADRHTQLELTQYFAEDIFFASNADEEARVWDDLLNNVQKGWEVLENEDDEEEEKERERATNVGAGGNSRLRSRRQLQDVTDPSISAMSGYMKKQRNAAIEQLKRIGQTGKPTSRSPNEGAKRIKQSAVAYSDVTLRRLQENNANATGALDSCQLEWYGSQKMFSEARLWPIWKTQNDDDTALSPQVLFELCQAEEKTQKVLEDNGLCFGCDGTSNNGCHKPFSIVLFARFAIENGIEMTCDELRNAWEPIQTDAEAQWKTCAADITATHDPNEDTVTLPDSCPPFFSVSFVDDRFADTGRLAYTSSVFATRENDIDELYDIVDDFDRAGDFIKGAYDTQNENFVNKVADESLGRDMILAMTSAVVIAAAMLLHTRSPFVTTVGLLQIILSFPIAFFFYKLVGQLNYFPFLNFIGIFVIFALGADDVFVAFDKVKNARREMPNASVEDVAAIALPEAVSAMFLTTSTTAVAFFATAICPVAPIKCFAIFLGLLVVFDYILNIVLVFPALCIYDGRVGKSSCCCTSCCVSIACRRKKRNDGEDGHAAAGIASKSDTNEIQDEKPLVFIQRVLASYYNLLHRIRWPLLAACAVGFGLSCYFASTLELPTSGDVRVISESIQYEQNFVWRKNLLSKVLEDAGGSQAHVIWGVKPADTGNHNDPETWSKLVLDDDFEPSSQNAQMHLLEYCPNLFNEEFASSKSGFQCSIQRFHAWLQEQSTVDDKDQQYIDKCDGADGLPMAEEAFHSCLAAWSKLANETTILSRNERVLVITFPFNSRVRYDSEYSRLDDEWHTIEEWSDAQNDDAPKGVNQSYFSSLDFWWYDTNGQMLQTAYGSAAIALAAAAAIILFSSRSFVLTIFATLSVGYVLTSVTACLVGIGWTLGFLESICFAILIGISVDFVVHFSHAYSSLTGNASRSVRTKHAVVSMGPSILAAAATSMASAVIMIFTVITFFQKFAIILLVTICQAVIGSFVFYLTLSDCLGPSDPTHLIDRCLSKIFRRGPRLQKQEEISSESGTALGESGRNSNVNGNSTDGIDC